METTMPVPIDNPSTTSQPDARQGFYYKTTAGILCWHSDDTGRNTVVRVGGTNDAHTILDNIAFCAADMAWVGEGHSMEGRTVESMREEALRSLHDAIKEGERVAPSLTVAGKIYVESQRDSLDRQASVWGFHRSSVGGSAATASTTQRPSTR